MVDVWPTVAALVTGAAPLGNAAVPADAPPAFLLDADRRTGRVVVTPGVFDNRSVSLPTDFPSAGRLRAGGVTRVVLVRSVGGTPQPDLAHTLRRVARGRHRGPGRRRAANRADHRRPARRVPIDVARDPGDRRPAAPPAGRVRRTAAAPVRRVSGPGCPPNVAVEPPAPACWGRNPPRSRAGFARSALAARSTWAPIHVGRSIPTRKRTIHGSAGVSRRDAGRGREGGRATGMAGIAPNICGPLDGPPPPRSVLVVEDDVALSAGIDLLLRHYGYVVYTAGTVADGRRLLAGHDPDVVVLDLDLPDGSGLDLLELLRATRRKARVAVLTASVNPEHLRRLKELRPDRFLRKPMNFLDLLAGIRGDAAAA